MKAAKIGGKGYNWNLFGINWVVSNTNPQTGYGNCLGLVSTAGSYLSLQKFSLKNLVDESAIVETIST